MQAVSPMNAGTIATGCLDKMQVTPDAPVRYTLPLGETRVPLNAFIGRHIELRHTGNIHCTHCNRKTAKSFGQGYCYPCFKKLAQCDSCIVSPEKCHFHLGTCREPQWAETHCHTDHIVYLANSSGIKIGITRASQMPTRWLDQGATQALPIARVADRYLSGLFEVACKKFVADKTDWRALLRNDAIPVDLLACRDRLLQQTAADIQALQNRYGLHALQLLHENHVREFSYPVSRYPEKTSTLNFDKDPLVSGELLGIKGQYLLFANGALNIRKFTAYEIALSA
ncbi:MAG TPA: DUF2797 domain-containing protein [Pseudomonadales bacterium]|nr:DUF2797 domain-containing protein [Pseudomonadales bacterium]